MLIGSLLLGLIVGTYVPLNLSVIIVAGMILSIITPVLSPVICMFGMGLGVATTAKNIIETAFQNKTKEKVKTKEERKEVAKEAARQARHEFDIFSSTMAFTALPIYLLNLIEGLSKFLLPISVLTIVIQAWTTVKKEPEKIRSYGIVGLIILISAFIVINIGSPSSVFLYFLTLVSIPSSLKKQQSNVENNNTCSRTTTPLEAFLYGQGGNGSIITAIVLLQTILWGSGKDTLGTIINGSGAMLLDPFRITTCVTVIIFLLWFNTYRKEKEIKEYAKRYVENKKRNRLLELAINAVSLVFALTTVNPLLAVTMLLVGLIINAIVDTSVIRNFSVPALLLVGMLSI